MYNKDFKATRKDIRNDCYNIKGDSLYYIYNSFSFKKSQAFDDCIKFAHENLCKSIKLYNKDFHIIKKGVVSGNSFQFTYCYIIQSIDEEITIYFKETSQNRYFYIETK